MKKVKGAILFVTLISLILLVMNKFHFLYSTACGSGTAGLKLLAIYIGIVIIIFAVLNIKKRTKTNYICRLCKLNIEEDWVICPHCGTPVEERSTIK